MAQKPMVDEFGRYRSKGEIPTFDGTMFRLTEVVIPGERMVLDRMARGLIRSGIFCEVREYAYFSSWGGKWRMRRGIALWREGTRDLMA